MEELKMEVIKELKKRNYSELRIRQMMKVYDSDFPQFYKENWNAGTIIAAMVLGY
mgnify:CR=1 FL=1